MKKFDGQTNDPIVFSRNFTHRDENLKKKLTFVKLHKVDRLREHLRPYISTRVNIIFVLKESATQEKKTLFRERYTSEFEYKI